MDGAKSAVLEQSLIGVRRRAQALRSRSLSIPGRAAQAAGELRCVLEAIVDREPELAAARCSEHVLIAGGIALAGFDHSMLAALTPAAI
jgi:hypothetical protein